jgi:alcohol dehydrogenase YqhD (iron-dependent ADH family)
MKFLPNRREYTINFNIECDATNEQVMKAYFFGLKLDEILNRKLNENLTHKVRFKSRVLNNEQYNLRNKWLNEAIEETEEYFESFNFDSFIDELKRKGWRMDTMYIDKGFNRYKVEYYSTE